MTSFTLAFSSLGKRVFQLLDRLRNLPDIDGVEIIIVWQKNNCEQPLPNTGNIEVITESTLGLSKSRNAAIRAAKTDYIWFLDDDVEISANYIEDALALIQYPKHDFYRIQIGCLENESKTYKNYKPITTINKLNLLQVSSIEIIARVRFIRDNSLFFNEVIGLGTNYPGSEEIHFLIDAWEVGASFLFIDRVLVKHTCCAAERILATKNIFELRGATASRFHLIGILLLLRWTFRYFLQYKNVSFIFAMYKGYFKGYSSFQF